MRRKARPTAHNREDHTQKAANRWLTLPKNASSGNFRGQNNPLSRLMVMLPSALY